MGKVTVQVVDRDRGWRKIRRELRKLNINVDAGYFPQQTRQTSRGRVPLAMIAAVHEYGSPSRRIPARPFMRQTVARKRGEWFRLSERLLGRALDRNIRAQAISVRLGEQMVADIKETFTAGSFAPLKPSTIAGRRRRRPGGGQGVGTRPLIDTGRLRQGVMWKVRKARKAR